MPTLPTPSRARPLVTAITLLGCATISAVHLWLLFRSGQDPVATPVARLSLLEGGALHGFGLVAFAVAHVALATLLHRRDAGRLRRVAVVLIGVAAVLVVVLAVHFARGPSEPAAAATVNWPLWLLASLIGIAMGLLVPGLKRQGGAAHRFNLACLIAWLALIPLYLLVDSSWVGAYERLVGLVYAVWIVGLAVLLGRRASQRASAAYTPPR